MSGVSFQLANALVRKLEAYATAAACGCCCEIQAEDGTLFIIYDHQRYTLNRASKRGVGSVQIAVFGEEDVRAGKPVTDKVRLHQVVTQLQDMDDTSGAPGK